MYSDNITIFNRKSGGRGQPDTWYPTVIEGVNLNVDRAAIISKYGTESQDSVYMGIHYEKDGGTITIAGKTLEEPKSWGGTTETIKLDPDGDFFWKGKWDGGIVQDDETEFSPYGGFYGFMNATRDNVFAITKTATHSIIKVVEVWGK